MHKVKLKYLCKSYSTALSQQDISEEGKYKVFGASGFIGYLDEYSCDKDYLGIIKDGAGVGRIAQYPKRTSLLGTMAYIIPNANIDISWLKYSIQNLELGKSNARTTIPHIYFSDYGNMFVHYCDIDIQQQVADFLDTKCAQIDEILQKTRDTIAEYKKLKQSVITQAVTKGVRGERPMKDSGIEWIGEIPEEWEIRRIKTLGTYRNGLTFTPEDLVDKCNGTLVLRSSNIQNGKLHLEDNVYVASKIPLQMYVRKGDILICSRNGSRNLIGKNAIIDSNLEAAFGAFMMIFRCDYPKYMYYILNSSLFVYYLDTFLTSTINQLTGKNFGNMRIVYCNNIKEQQEIAQYLDEKCAEIGTLIEKKEQLVNELESYKKSLIYEYVTGKKEVL